MAWKILILGRLPLITCHFLFVNFIVSEKLLIPARRQRLFFKVVSRAAYLFRVFLAKVVMST